MPDAADPQPLSASSPRLTFRPRHRLTHAREFKAVYDAKMRKARGGLVVFTRPNDLPHCRLGLAVSARTIPKAVERNRVKRLIREWFRLNQHELTDHLDIIVSVRTGRAMTLASLAETTGMLVAESAAEWRRRFTRPVE